jgi:hypothetical protein
MCTVSVMLYLAFACVIAVLMQLRCTDAAREVARSAARSTSGSFGSIMAELAPGGARLQVDKSEVDVRVDVRADLGLLPGISLRGHAYALVEQESS